MPGVRTERNHRLSCALFVIYLVVLSWLVLFKLQFSIPVIEEGRVINLIPMQGSFRDDGSIRFGEIRNNMIAFMPLGVYLCLLKRTWPSMKKVLTIIALTISYETVQFVFVIGRADITDVLSNALGGILGIGVYTLLSKLLKGKTNLAITIIASVLTFSILALITLLLASNRWFRIQ